eukprot:g3978.t1
MPRDRHSSRSPKRSKEKERSSRRHRSRSLSRDKYSRRKKAHSPSKSRHHRDGKEDGHSSKSRRSREKRREGRSHSGSPTGGQSPSHSDQPRNRSRKSAFSGPADGGPAHSVQQLQQQQLQRQLLAQQLLLQQNALTGTNALIANKKQREVYVGNLTIGIVTAEMLRELFNGALSSLVPDPITNPPVVSVNMDASGRFGFVEMRSEELANAAMQMDKVELCGRHVNIGRPRGYVEPPANMLTQSKLGMAEQFAKTLTSMPSKTVLLENLLTTDELTEPDALNELMDEVKAECEKWSTVIAVACPLPSSSVKESLPSRVYIKLSTSDEAKRVKEFMDGRTFDNNVVTSQIVPDADFSRAEKGEWIID